MNYPKKLGLVRCRVRETKRSSLLLKSSSPDAALGELVHIQTHVYEGLNLLSCKCAQLQRDCSK